MAEVVALHRSGAAATSLAAAVEAFLTGSDLAASTRAVYEGTLTMIQVDLPAEVSVGEVTTSMLEAHLQARYEESAPATYNRNLATICSLFTWCVDRDLLPRSPARGIRWRKARRTVEAERQSRPISLEVLEALWSDARHRLRDRVYWAMAYDTAARADELLGLDVDNIDLADRCAMIIGKGGSAERIFWSSTTARRLPRLINGRTTGPVFVGDLKPRTHLAQLPTTSTRSQARLACPTDGPKRSGKQPLAVTPCTSSVTPD